MDLKKPNTNRILNIVGEYSDLDCKIDSLNNLPLIKEKYFGSYLDISIKDSNNNTIFKSRIDAENFDSNHFQTVLRIELQNERLRLERRIKKIETNLKKLE